jgi:hypothetical protein
MRRGAKNRRVLKAKGKTIYTYYYTSSVLLKDESFEDDELSK